MNTGAGIPTDQFEVFQMTVELPGADNVARALAGAAVVPTALRVGVAWVRRGA